MFKGLLFIEQAARFSSVEVILIETTKQKVLFAIIAVLCLILCILTTFIVVKHTSMKRTGQGGYQNITFTDAVMTCTKEVEIQFAGKYRSLVVDDHSSRYERGRLLYKIFLNVDIPSAETGKMNMHYVNCFVKSTNGRITKYELLEDSPEGTTTVVDDGTNAFGWPKSTKKKSSK